MINGMKEGYQKHQWPWLKPTQIDNFVDNELGAIKKKKPMKVNRNEMIYKQKHDARTLLKQGKSVDEVATFLYQKYHDMNPIQLSSFKKCATRIEAELNKQTTNTNTIKMPDKDKICPECEGPLRTDQWPVECAHANCTATAHRHCCWPDINDKEKMLCKSHFDLKYANIFKNNY